MLSFILRKAFALSAVPVLEEKQNLNLSSTPERPKEDNSFSIKDIALVAREHPFYSPNHIYPPKPEVIARISSASSEATSQEDFAQVLSQFPILCRDDIYKQVTRLVNDTHADNTFRHATYISVTGGGGGLNNMLAFFTDIQENRMQRAACSRLMHSCGLLSEKDCVLSMHTSGKLYRALELTTELVEGTGASLLPAGHLATPEEILIICQTFHPTVISGDASQIIRLAAHIETAGLAEGLGIKKVLFTSEPLTRSQRLYLTSVFGDVEFISIFASAEMGPWAVSNYSVITPPPDDETVDFIFDSRQMVVEVLPMDFKLTPETCNYPCKLEDEGKAGLLAVTSLQRLRHPLIRYLIGDIGSVHRIPEAAKPLIKRDTEHLRILRLYGRDTRRSFKWFGDYFDLGILHRSMLNTSWGVLKWQVILDKDPIDKISDTLEVRILRGTGRSTEPTSMILQDDELLEVLKVYFCVDKVSVDMFQVKFVNSEGFIRSRTGNKVIAFVDQRKD